MSVQQIGSGSGVTGVINSGAVQVAEAASVSVETGTHGIVVPFIAELYADASGTVGTLQQVTVTMTGIDQVFEVQVSEADAVKILNAFAITDVSAGYGASSWAEVQVDMKNEASFEEGLIAAFAGNPASSTGSGKTLYDWLKDESRKDTVDLLSYDSLANLLEASDLLTYDIAIDASGAASNMYDSMNAVSAIAAKYRKAIFTQISKSNIDAYLTPSDGNNINYDDVSGLAFLPLLKGDKMTFVFDVTVGEYGWDNSAPQSGAKVTSVINDASVSFPSGTYGGSTTTQQEGNFDLSNTNGANYSGLYAAGQTQLLFTTPSTRRIAIVVEMSTGGSTFTHPNLHAGGELTVA